MLYDTKHYNRKHIIRVHTLQQNRELDLLLSFVWWNSLDGEEWREIKGLDGRYYVSSYGRVLSLCCDGYKLLKPFVCGSGYYCVDLRKDNQDIKCRVNRLVAEAFVENPRQKTIVHHIDMNKLNNHCQNLTYLSPKEHINEHKRVEDEKKLFHQVQSASKD